MKKKQYVLENSGTTEMAVITVLINGEQKEAIPAFTEYSIKRKDYSKNTSLEQLDKSKILPTLFAFTSTKPFREEGVALFDFYGTEIPKELDKEVLVNLDKSDTINLFEVFETPFDSVMVECESVADAYRRVATTSFFSQSPTKDEWINLAVATTKDNVLSQILQFAKDKKMNGTAAQSYFGLTYRVPSLQKAAMTMVSPLEDAKFRSLEEATKLFQAIEKAFGAKCAVQTHYVKAINTSIKIYSLDEVVEALNVINEEKKQLILGARGTERDQRIQAFISERIVLCRNDKKAA